MPTDFLDVLQKLRTNGAEFVIVGGVAAMLHGGNRVTFDIDLVPSLTPESWRHTIDLLWSLGARPRIPETLAAIHDVENIAEKGMLALNMRSPSGDVEINLLVAESGRFEALRARAIPVKVRDVEYYVASINDLIEMKRKAGRPHDLQDVETLEAIRRAK